ncbi:hypothetical protein BX666DRAFT_2002834 [Dichotomocladium elegans]|nr:hypothetical protein BX666DRAFT_2002834 [Dichotomocladium elegans]
MGGVIRRPLSLSPWPGGGRVYLCKFQWGALFVEPFFFASCLCTGCVNMCEGGGACFFLARAFIALLLVLNTICLQYFCHISLFTHRASSPLQLFRPPLFSVPPHPVQHSLF